jgi:hypothetical protein
MQAGTTHAWKLVPPGGVCTSTGFAAALRQTRSILSPGSTGDASAWVWKKLPSSGTKVAAAV